MSRRFRMPVYQALDGERPIPGAELFFRECASSEEQLQENSDNLEGYDTFAGEFGRQELGDLTWNWEPDSETEIALIEYDDSQAMAFSLPGLGVSAVDKSEFLLESLDVCNEDDGEIVLRVWAVDELGARITTQFAGPISASACESLDIDLPAAFGYFFEPYQPLVYYASPNGVGARRLTDGSSWNDELVTTVDVSALATDDVGNIYSRHTTGSGEVFTKRDRHGSEIWARDDLPVNAQAIAVDSDFNAYICADNRVIKLDADDGSTLIDIDTDSEMPEGLELEASRITLDRDGNIYVAGAPGNPADGVYVLSYEASGASRWVRGQLVNAEDLISDAGGIAVNTDGVLFVAVRNVSGGGVNTFWHHLGLDSQTGETLWSVGPVGDSAFSFGVECTRSGLGVFYMQEGPKLRAYHSDGTIAWEYEMPADDNPGLTVDAMGGVIAIGDGELHRVSQIDGESIWSVNLGATADHQGPLAAEIGAHPVFLVPGTGL